MGSLASLHSTVLGCLNSAQRRDVWLFLVLLSLLLFIGRRDGGMLTPCPCSIHRYFSGVHSPRVHNFHVLSEKHQLLQDVFVKRKMLPPDLTILN